MSDFYDIVLSPKEVQNLLDCIDVIPSNHFICIEKDIDTEKIYVVDCGKDCNDENEGLEITEYD